MSYLRWLSQQIDEISTSHWSSSGIRFFAIDHTLAPRQRNKIDSQCIILAIVWSSRSLPKLEEKQ
jgi:hypothetical protein